MFLQKTNKYNKNTAINLQTSDSGDTKLYRDRISTISLS